MEITLSQLRSIMPNSRSKSSEIIDSLNIVLDSNQINTPNRIGAFLAQVAHESSELRYVEEIGSGNKYNDRHDLGNTDSIAIAAASRRGKTVGEMYKGHGFLQITGFFNHKECGEDFGLDLINWPELLKIPEYAIASAGWFWNSRHLNSLADSGLFEQITRRINGGLNGFDNRLMYYKRALKILT